jgi:cytochrome b pre-mRNA-processing protein 3
MLSPVNARTLPILARATRQSRSLPLLLDQPRRLQSTSPKQQQPTSTGTGKESESWLTQKIRASPAAMKVFMGLAKGLGYASPAQVAARRAFGIYEDICLPRADQDAQFWRECTSFSSIPSFLCLQAAKTQN